MTACARIGCKRDATHLPKVCVPATGHPIEGHQPLDCVITLPCCRAHAMQFDIKGFLDNPHPSNPNLNFRSMFQLLAAGRTPPDFDRAYIEPILLTAEIAQKLIEQAGAQGANQSIPAGG